jgi:ComF family protein
MLQALSMVFFPPRCGACNNVLLENNPTRLCAACGLLLEFNASVRCVICDLPGARRCPRCQKHPPAFSALRAPYVYGGPVQDLITAAKFNARPDLAKALGHLILQTEICDFVQDATLVPVPLGWQRRFKRGFNQSAVVARIVAHALRRPMVYALKRRRNTRPQSDLALSERLLNVQEAFVARQKLEGHYVLVDDVVTSGETVEQAARALKLAGAQDVRVLAVARTE